MTEPIRIHEPDPCHRLLEAEVSPEECLRETEQVLDRLARSVRVHGFRPGKVPREVVRRQFGKAIREEVQENVVRRHATDGLRQHGIEPLREGELQDLTWEGEGPLRFRVLFEVRPLVEPRDYKGLRLTRRVRPVTPGEVEEILQALREENFRLEPVDRTVAESEDYALVDFVELPAHEGEAPRVDEGVYFRVGDGKNFPAVNQALLGLPVGEEREFTVEYPQDHPDPARAGRRIGCRVRCKGIKVRVLPDLDDEFARGISTEPDLAALRAKVESDLVATRRRDADRALEQELLDSILGSNPVPAPPTLVEEQAGESFRRVIESMVRQGIDPSRVRVDWADEQRKIREAADRQVRAGIVLDRIGQVEGIEIAEEDVERTLREKAQQERMPYEKLRAGIEKADGGRALRASLRRRRILDFLLQAANISTIEETRNATHSDGG